MRCFPISLAVINACFFVPPLAAQEDKDAVERVALGASVVAVLPPKNLTDNSELSALAEDLYEEMLNQLGSVDGLVCSWRILLC